MMIVLTKVTGQKMITTHHCKVLLVKPWVLKLFKKFSALYGKTKFRYTMFAAARRFSLS
jgi:hypothetical protein